jgi:hypothetical protein
MIKRLQILSIVILLLPTSASPSEVAVFYESEVSQRWAVRGAVLKEQALVPTCTAETKSTNGSYLHLSKDIDADVYFLWAHNTDWNLVGKEVVVRLDFYDQKGSLSYASLSAIAQGSNSLDIPVEEPKEFLERFILSNEIVFTLPNRNSKFKVAVDKPIEIVVELDKCIDAWKTGHRTQ